MSAKTHPRAHAAGMGGNMIRITSMICCLIFCASTGDANAQARVYEKTAARGKTVAILSLVQYQTARGCTAGPAGAIDTSPKPRFGTVLSKTVLVKQRGPCDVQEYPTQVIGYTAGNTSGVDEFILYVHSSAFFGGSANEFKMKVTVR